VVAFARVGGGAVGEIDGIGGVEGDCLGVRVDCGIMLFGGHLGVSGLLVLLCLLLVLCGGGLGRGGGGGGSDLVSRLEKDLEYGVQLCGLDGELLALDIVGWIYAKGLADALDWTG
jgi:hypothetical protein